MAFWACSDLGSRGVSGRLGSEAEGGASSVETDAVSLAMERVMTLRLRRPWLLAVFLPRGVFCSFPSSSSPPSHLSLSLPISLWFWTGVKTAFSCCYSKYLFPDDAAVRGCPCNLLFFQLTQDKKSIIIDRLCSTWKDKLENC